jgi:pimeloyl-ACP methyl ester carboxylesterase
MSGSILALPPSRYAVRPATRVLEDKMKICSLKALLIGLAVALLFVVDGSFAAPTLCNAESYDASETIVRDPYGPNSVIHKNKSYGVVGRPCNRMDLHYEIGGNRPIILFLHGGGWSAGDKAGYNGVCKTMYYHGYACANINYRLYKVNNYEGRLAQTDDLLAAVQELTTSSKTFGMDPGRMVFIGHSAGSAIVALWASRSLPSQPPSLRASVKGVILMDQGGFDWQFSQEFAEAHAPDGTTDCYYATPASTSKDTYNCVSYDFSNQTRLMNVAQRKNLSPYWNIIGSSTAGEVVTPTYYFPDALIMHGLATPRSQVDANGKYYTGHRKGHSYAVRDYNRLAGVRFHVEALSKAANGGTYEVFGLYNAKHGAFVRDLEYTKCYTNPNRGPPTPGCAAYNKVMSYIAGKVGQ